MIKDKTYPIINDVITIFKEKVFNPVYDILTKVMDKVTSFISGVIKDIKDVVYKIIESVNKLFGSLSENLYNAGTFISKYVFYIGFYSFTNLVDKLIPLSVPKTIKVNLVIVTILYFVFVYFTSQITTFVKTMMGTYYILFVLLISFIVLYFTFPKVDSIQMPQIPTETSIPTKIEKYTDDEEKEKIIEAFNNDDYYLINY